MKRILLLLLTLTVAISVCSCSADTYTQESTSKKFKLKNVSAISLYGPSTENNEGIQIDLNATNGTDFTRLVQLVQGSKLTECETDNFGLCYISYSFTTGETVKVYPANDGSHYMCLYSLNGQLARYLSLSEENMEEIVNIFEKYQIQVIYS